LSPGRASDECSLCELFKVAQGTDVPHTSSATSSSFEEKLAPSAAPELPDFEKTGHCRPYQYTPNTHDGVITDGPTMARFSLNGRAPRLTGAIILAQRIHAALVELSNGSGIFTGCDERGKPLTGHAHAYILGESNLALGRGQCGDMTHVTIYAPAGFGSPEITVLEGLREVRGSGLEAQLSLLGLGQPEDFGGFDASKGESSLLAESRRWTSRTPFIPTRHPKATRAGVPKLDSTGLQIGSPEHELRRLMSSSSSVLDSCNWHIQEVISFITDF